MEKTNFQPKRLNERMACFGELTVLIGKLNELGEVSLN